MRVQHQSGQYPPIEIPEGAWPVYKAQGYIQVLNPETIPPQIEVRWSVQRGRFIGDYECPPFIAWSATNGTKGYCESQLGTAHKTVKVYIPGQRPNTCPEHVAQDYVRLFNEWAAKRKKKSPPVEQVSFGTPKIPGVSPYSGATKQPWNQDVEYRGNK